MVRGSISIHLIGNRTRNPTPHRRASPKNAARSYPSARPEERRCTPRSTCRSHEQRQKTRVGDTSSPWGGAAGAPDKTGGVPSVPTRTGAAYGITNRLAATAKNKMTTGRSGGCMRAWSETPSPLCARQNATRKPAAVATMMVVSPKEFVHLSGHGYARMAAAAPPRTASLPMSESTCSFRAQDAGKSLVRSVVKAGKIVFHTFSLKREKTRASCRTCRRQNLEKYQG